MPVVGVSIPVPAPHGDHLQASRASYGDPLADLVPAHVTLLGPTEVDEADLDALVGHLTEAAREVPPFRVVLRGTGSFRPVSQVVFVQVAEGIASCERLEQAIRRGPYDQALRFPYHPHVTVAHDVPQDHLDRAFDELADFGCEFRVDAMTLYQRDDDGLWRESTTIPLGGHPPC